MTVGQLSELLDHIGADRGSGEVLDLLWLASHITPRDSAPEAVPGPPDPAAPREWPHGAGPGRPAPSGPWSPPALYEDRRPDRRPQMTGPPASVVRAPEAPALADTLGLSRSLRRLKKYKQSRHEWQIDEVASAETVAETEIWMPALRPKPQRWMDLALVVDAYESMDLWRSAALSFLGILEDLGAFSDVRLWNVSWAGAGGRPEIRSAASGSSARSPKELVRPSGDLMVVIFSDCVDPGLQSPQAADVLAQWSEAGPVAIVQPLPQRLWGYTSVTPVHVRFRPAEAGVPNKRLSYEELYPSDDDLGTEPVPEPGQGPRIPIPVIDLSPVAAHNWSRLVTGSGADGVDAMALLLRRPGRSDREGLSQPTLEISSTAYTAEELVRRFQIVASPGAMRLAECLAATPVSVPVMRLIQEAVLDRKDNAAVAEVFLGGLLRRVAAQGEKRYDFVHGVRDCLAGRLPHNQAISVLMAVADSIGKSQGRAREFRALIAGEGIDGDLLLDSASRPFALAAAPVLARLGGAYALSATQIQRRADGIAETGPAVIASPAEAGSAGPLSDVQGRPAEAGDGQVTGNTDSERLADFSKALGSVTVPPGRSRRHPLVCPYCFHAFAGHELMFRCSGIPRADRTACPRSVDPVLQSEMNIGLLMPPLFSSSARGDTARCPYCRGMTGQQACPKCHSSLPAGFRSASSGLVAFIGSAETGKTAFMTVLIHELMYSVGEQLGSSIPPADDTTYERFMASYKEPLYDHQTLLPPTSPGKGYLRPLVFRLQIPDPGSRRGHIQELLLSFADSAGEDLVSPEKVALMARYLAAADAVVMVIDPLQLDSVRNSITADMAMPSLRDPMTSLERVTRLLAAAAKTDVIEKPTAVVMTKLDAIWDLLPEGTVLRQAPATLAPFDFRDSDEVQEEVELFLREHGGEGITRLLSRRYANWRYFAVSALGSPPTSENLLSITRPRPHRIADPMMWILSVLGMSQRRGRQT